MYVVPVTIGINIFFMFMHIYKMYYVVSVASSDERILLVGRRKTVFGSKG